MTMLIDSLDTKLNQIKQLNEQIWAIQNNYNDIAERVKVFRLQAEQEKKVEGSGILIDQLLKQYTTENIVKVNNKQALIKLITDFNKDFKLFAPGKEQKAISEQEEADILKNSEFGVGKFINLIIKKCNKKKQVLEEERKLAINERLSYAEQQQSDLLQKNQQELKSKQDDLYCLITDSEFVQEIKSMREDKLNYLGQINENMNLLPDNIQVFVRQLEERIRRENKKQGSKPKSRYGVKIKIPAENFDLASLEGEINEAKKVEAVRFLVSSLVSLSAAKDELIKLGMLPDLFAKYLDEIGVGYTLGDLDADNMIYFSENIDKVTVVLRQIPELYKKFLNKNDSNRLENLAVESAVRDIFTALLEVRKDGQNTDEILTNSLKLFNDLKVNLDKQESDCYLIQQAEKEVGIFSNSFQSIAGDINITQEKIKNSGLSNDLLDEFGEKVDRAYSCITEYRSYLAKHKVTLERRLGVLEALKKDLPLCSAKEIPVKIAGLGLLVDISSSDLISLNISIKENQKNSNLINRINGEIDTKCESIKSMLSSGGNLACKIDAKTKEYGRKLDRQYESLLRNYNTVSGIRDDLEKYRKTFFFKLGNFFTLGAHGKKVAKHHRDIVHALSVASARMQNAAENKHVFVKTPLQVLQQQADIKLLLTGIVEQFANVDVKKGVKNFNFMSVLANLGGYLRLLYPLYSTEKIGREIDELIDGDAIFKEQIADILKDKKCINILGGLFMARQELVEKLADADNIDGKAMDKLKLLSENLNIVSKFFGGNIKFDEKSIKSNRIDKAMISAIQEYCVENMGSSFKS